MDDSFDNFEFDDKSELDNLLDRLEEDQAFSLLDEAENDAEDQEISDKVIRFQTGDLTFEEYQELSHHSKKLYRDMHKGRRDHVKGRPLAPFEKKAQEKKRRKRKKKKKRARKSRRNNFRRKKGLKKIA